ncbi:dihydroorotase [Clostridia bacterium]|nr:dihydroorotase [Clostridia bacterium]
MELLIKNGLLYTESGFIKRDLLCRDNLIAEIGENISGEAYIDAENLVVSPGFVDLHTHLREPGFSYKETIATGTAAAIAGGFTTVCAMPNLNPVPDSAENLAIQQEIIARDACCQVLPFMSITLRRLGVHVTSPVAGCVGVSDDGSGVQSEEVMAEAMKQAAGRGILISAHCEDENLVSEGGCVHDGVLVQNGLLGINSESEYIQVQRDLKLAAKYRCRYHVCHVSTKESIEMIRKAKSDGLPVSCEVTPHHALLCEDDVVCDDGRFKMAPPLRSSQDRSALVEALLDGTVDAIATDHAPHAAFEKNRGLKESAMGVVGLECAFAALYTDLVKTAVMPFERLLFLLTFGPSNVIKLPCGLEIGNKANITLMDPNATWVIDSRKFFSKGHSTPFDGKKVVGKVVSTIFEGKKVYQY